MRLKRFLIVAPIAFLVVLLQSYFWVPRYETHALGNASRTTKYIEASIGDAKLLNPAVNSDSASSRITDLVFDGLLELGPDLTLIGRLASAWEVSEKLYLLVDTSAHFNDGTLVTADLLLSRVEAAVSSGALASVSSAELLPATTRNTSLSRQTADGQTVDTQVVINTPPRILLHLNRVEQDMLVQLAPIVGHAYVENFDLAPHVVIDEDTAPLSDSELSKLLPIVEHNPVIDFSLRKDVTFHDGHPFDAGDVKFTYEAIMNPRSLSPRTSNFELIKSLEVIDDHAVRVTYKRLFSPAIEAWTIGIIPEHLLNEERLNEEMETLGLSTDARQAFGLRDSAFNRNPVGTGPFRFVEWQGDEFIHLTRNEQYWAGAPEFRDFYYRVIPDALTQEMEFRTGAIDRYAPQPHQVSRFRESQDFQTYSSPGYSFSYIGYNNRRPPFDDVRVRRALGMAVDVEEIIAFILHGEAEPTSGPYPTNTQWYDHDVAPLPFNPQRASQLLADAGWTKNADGWLEKDGKIFEFNLVTNNGNLVRKAIMTIAQDNWRKIGIKCNTQLFEWAVFLEDFINPANFDAVVLGWSMSIDPDLYAIWHSSETGFGQFNFVGYSSSEADDLILRIRQEYDPQVQRILAHKLHRNIADAQPYTFLFASLATRVFDRKIVMLDDDGQASALKVPASGDPFYYFTRWKKLGLSPDS